MSTQNPETSVKRHNKDFYDRIDKLIEFNKKELETNPIDKKLLANENKYERVFLELKTLEYHQSLITSTTKEVNLDSKIQAKEKELEKQRSTSFLKLKEHLSYNEGIDVLLPRSTTDNIEYVLRTLPSSRKNWTMPYYLVSSEPPNDDIKYVPRIHDLYMNYSPDSHINEETQVVLEMKTSEFKEMIKDLPKDLKLMDYRITYNWFHRLRNMKRGVYYIKKFRTGFSNLVRTPQYLRLCYAMGVIDEEQWRDLTIKEEETCLFAIEAVPILEEWIKDMEDFLINVKDCESSEEMLEQVKQYNSVAKEYIDKMKSLDDKYSDHTAFDVYTFNFFSYTILR